MKYESQSRCSFEKNVIGRAFVARWGWESPAIRTSGCGKQAAPVRKSKRAREDRHHYKND
ncbi:MAG: hypothetical protein HN985_11395 [Planctomycetaceae bacterium]|nr:hypothetical protein [Planctomycetaceae bacterium]MBT7729319.1 hypothetical protein [Planctomycetaceae bacterium]